MEERRNYVIYRGLFSSHDFVHLRDLIMQQNFTPTGKEKHSSNIYTRISVVFISSTIANLRLENNCLTEGITVYVVNLFILPCPAFMKKPSKSFFVILVITKTLQFEVNVQLITISALTKRLDAMLLCDLTYWKKYGKF